MASAPVLFQKMMEVILRGTPWGICYIVDILVSGKDEESHFDERDISLPGKYGFWLKQKKNELLL